MNSTPSTGKVKLVSLCIIEMAERFSFHIMRGIIVLYMIKVLHFSDSFSYTLFATFTALLYFTPLIGGYLADIYFGKENAVLIGCLTLTLGYFLLYVTSGGDNFYFAFAMIAIGNGFFMPNIANCIGDLYLDNKSQREAGFSVFYTALNIGAFLPPFITTWIILFFGWQAAFLISSIIMLVTSTFFMFAYASYAKHTKINVPLTIGALLLFGFCLAISIKYTIIANVLIYFLGALLTAKILKKSFLEIPLVRKRLHVCLFLTFFSILFWLMAEQSALSLAVFTEYNVDRTFAGISISTLFFFSLNPFFIILLSPLFSKIWLQLAQKKMNPSIPIKFALGTILMGFGFLTLPLAIHFQNPQGYVNSFWIITSYFLQASGELILSPIGLSMIVELTPDAMAGLMMGLWYFATAIAYLLAGYVSQFTACPIHNNPLLSSARYSQVFNTLGWITVASGIIIFLCARLMKKFMQQQQQLSLVTQV